MQTQMAKHPKTTIPSVEKAPARARINREQASAHSSIPKVFVAFAQSMRSSRLLRLAGALLCGPVDAPSPFVERHRESASEQAVT